MFKTGLDKFKENFNDKNSYLHSTDSLKELKTCVYDMNSFVESVDEYFMKYGSFTPDYPYFSNDTIDMVFDFDNKKIELNPLANQEAFDLVCFSFEKEYCKKYGLFPQKDNLEKVAKNFYKKHRTAVEKYINTKTTPTAYNGMFKN